MPPGFTATKDDYVDWLIGEVEKVGEPVDIVGHDWGSLLVQRVVSQRPDLVRTWAAGAATVDREYVWHDLAQMWQTPEVGEQVMAAMTGDALVDTLADQVGGREKAVAMASHIDDTMKQCVLALYRSAASGFGEWHDDVDDVLPTRPGAVFWGADDPYVTANFGERLAARTRRGSRCSPTAATGGPQPSRPTSRPASNSSGRRPAETRTQPSTTDRRRRSAPADLVRGVPVLDDAGVTLDAHAVEAAAVPQQQIEIRRVLRAPRRRSPRGRR